jgi:hypothetical protein
METWFELTEDEYQAFLSSCDTAERVRIADKSFRMQTYFCRSKAKLLSDMAFQVLDFSTTNSFGYQSLCGLLCVMTAELRYLAEQRDNTNTGAAATSAAQRFKTTVCGHCIS